MVDVCLYFQEAAKFLLIVVVLCYTPTAVYKASSCSTFLPALSIAGLLNFKYFNWYMVVSC